MIFGFSAFCAYLHLPCIFLVHTLVFNPTVGFEPQRRLVIVPSRNINQLSCPADQFGEEVIWKEAQADIMGRSRATCH